MDVLLCVWQLNIRLLKYIMLKVSSAHLLGPYPLCHSVRIRYWHNTISVLVAWLSIVFSLKLACGFLNKVQKICNKKLEYPSTKKKFSCYCVSPHRYFCERQAHIQITLHASGSHGMNCTILYQQVFDTISCHDA